MIDLKKLKHKLTNLNRSIHILINNKGEKYVLRTAEEHFLNPKDGVKNLYLVPIGK